MTNARTLLFLAACALSFAAAAADAPPADAAADAAKAPGAAELIERLGAERPAEREAAHEALAKLGKSALPQLRAASYHAKAEVRWRAEHLMAEAAPADAWSDSLRARLDEAKVSLDADNAPLDEVLRQWADAAGVPLALSPHLARALAEKPLRATLHIKEYGARLALERLLDDQGLSYALVFNGVVVEGGAKLRGTVLRELLDTKVPPLAFKNTPLRAALEEVRAALPAGLAFDDEVFKQEDVQALKVNLTTTRALRLETVLAMLLDGHDLGYLFDDRRVFVTSKDRTDDGLVTVDYALGPLVQAIERRTGQDGPDKIAEALRACVDARAWTKGSGTSWRGEDVLAVTQRRSSQERVAAFLKLLQQAEGILDRPPDNGLEF